MWKSTQHQQRYTSGLRQRSGGVTPWAEPLEDRRLLASDLSIVEAISLAKGVLHETPQAQGTLAGGLFVELNQIGQVQGMTLTTPDNVDLTVDDFEVDNGVEEWFLEDDDMTQAEWDTFGDGLYTLAIDLGAGGVHTVDILFAQDNNDPLLTVNQQPMPTSPSHGATGVDLQIDLAWEPVTDDNVNLIVVSLDEEPSGDIIIDEFLDDTNTTSIDDVNLSADSDYECELVFANGIIRGARPVWLRHRRRQVRDHRVRIHHWRRRRPPSRPRRRVPDDRSTRRKRPRR